MFGFLCTFLFANIGLFLKCRGNINDDDDYRLSINQLINQSINKKLYSTSYRIIPTVYGGA